MKRLLLLSLCVSLISAIAFDAPLATPAWKGFQLEPHGWSAKPTESPSMALLRKRQNIQNLLLASDGICGFISGVSASPFGLCCSSCTCGFATTQGRSGALYCCNTAACESRIPTTCIDNNRFSMSGVCDSNCISDQLTLKCTAPPYIYCNLVEFEGVNVQAQFCDTVTISHVQSILTTYAGEVGRILSTFTGFPSSSSTSLSSTTPSSSSSTSSSPSSTPTTSSTQSQTIPATQTTSSSPATPTDSPSAAPIGAIVGGSVGGAAVLAIIGVLIFFLFRSKSTKHATQHAQAASAPGDSISTPPAGYAVATQQAPMHITRLPGSVTPSYPQQAYSEGYYQPQQQQSPYQYQQAQYPGPDNRYSQQSQPHSQQYQPPYDPSQQLEAQYNGRASSSVPGRVELQAATGYPADGRAASSGRQVGRGRSGGRYDVQG